MSINLNASEHWCFADSYSQFDGAWNSFNTLVSGFQANCVILARLLDSRYPILPYLQKDLDAQILPEWERGSRLWEGKPPEGPLLSSEMVACLAPQNFHWSKLKYCRSSALRLGWRNMGHSLWRFWALTLWAHVTSFAVCLSKATGLGWMWIYHFYTDIGCELPAKSQQLLFMQGWHSGEGVYYPSRQLFCQPGPIRSLAVGLSTNERRPGKRTSVQLQCSARSCNVEQRHCAGALASSPVTWSYRRWCWNWSNQEL